MQEQSTISQLPVHQEKIGKKFLFISREGLIGDLAWQIKKEGNEVKYWIHSKFDKDVCDGFVDKTDDWTTEKD